MPIYALTVARSDGRLGADLRRLTVDCGAETEASAQNVVKGAPVPGDRASCGIQMGKGALTVRGDEDSPSRC
ncbi:MAG: hypothetical protein HYR88_07715 [Verrucomicrobia bacterium]|nr:hypothetical protein [Verrucomicrobiota bacterium]